MLECEVSTHTTMALVENQPHFVLFPFLAQGHLIPMVDIARLLASRGVLVTILLTPLNHRRIQPVIDRAAASALSIDVSLLKFPCVEVGLPEGCENCDVLPSVDDMMKFFSCTSMLKEQVKNLLIDLKPNCLIADFCYPWAADLCLDLHIPRLVFHGMSCFALVMWSALDTVFAMEAGTSDMDYIVVPDLPDRIEITRAQLRGTRNQMSPDWDKVRREILGTATKAFGTVANTFEELEPEYIKRYAEKTGNKVWCIGPVSLCNDDVLDKAERGNKASIDKQECWKWLDSREPRSVVYVCLGSLSRTAASQLTELGLALEASNRPFIWVVKNASDEFKTWLNKENFEERVKARPGGPGLLIQGWAPQVLILSHPSVGGFLTHCGWNSTLEGITAGLPMVTWPAMGEQFSNEKFVVNVIKTGVRVGVEIPVHIGEEEDVGVQVKHEEIRMAIDEMMDGGDEGEGRRERARKLGEMAKKAVANGGSSCINMTRLIQDVLEAKFEEECPNEAKLDHMNCCSKVVVQ